VADASIQLNVGDIIDQDWLDAATATILPGFFAPVPAGTDELVAVLDNPALLGTEVQRGQVILLNVEIRPEVPAQAITAVSGTGHADANSLVDWDFTVPSLTLLNPGMNLGSPGVTSLLLTLHTTGIPAGEAITISWNPLDVPNPEVNAWLTNLIPTATTPTTAAGEATLSLTWSVDAPYLVDLAGSVELVFTLPNGDQDTVTLIIDFT
jgi:hypothetical protein